MFNMQFMSESDDYFDVRVNAHFDSSISPFDIVNMMKIIHDAVSTSSQNKVYFAGFESITISVSELSIIFRFLRNLDEVRKLTWEEREELPKLMAHYVFRVFARIDKIYRLRDVPFPLEFRDFIDSQD